MSTESGMTRATQQGEMSAPTGATERRSLLEIEQILWWADAHRSANGSWPNLRSGPVAGSKGEKWSAIDTALRKGLRGMSGQSSLSRLLEEERGVWNGVNPETPGDRLRAWEAERFPARRPKKRQPLGQTRSTVRLSIDLILTWADAFHQATGGWPRTNTGQVRECPELNWSQVNRALDQGCRGLPGGTTLPKLLEARRGVRNKQNLPRLDVEQVLAWADAHREATGHFPHGHSGPVLHAPGETWVRINASLYMGLRGFPGDSSLKQLLAEHRDYRPPLTVERILAWADAHFEATGKWPTSWSSGPVRDVPGETWISLDMALNVGRRGLPGGMTLARLLADQRNAPNIYTEPPLRVDLILAWADAHHASTGKWPSANSGPVLHAEGERWGSIETALREGYRSLPGGQALGRLIREHAGLEAYVIRPRLTVEQILEWADVHREATGDWPIEDSGPVLSAEGENWKAISASLRLGSRGLPGGSSLARLLAEHRGARNMHDLPRLDVEQVLAWADAHHKTTGRWPSSKSGPVAEGSEETWAIVNAALMVGHRGLPGGSSLAILLSEHRPRRPRRLSIQQIRGWARAHREATGRWPDAHAGPVRGVPEETWWAVDAALKFGRRGLPGGTNLTALFGRSLDPVARAFFRPKLTVEQVLAWADSHRKATGKWPTHLSGQVEGQPGEKWVNINMALQHGRRGLPGGMTLARFIARHRGESTRPRPNDPAELAAPLASPGAA